MTKRWRHAALVLAFLGFLSWARYLGVAEDPVQLLFTATLNGAIWFGVVYLVFLVVRVLLGIARRIGDRRSRRD